MNERGYCLAPHVHVCRSDRHFILLDLKRDRYIGFSSSAGNLLHGFVEGWPESPVKSAVPTMLNSMEIQTSEARSRQDLLQTMLRDGVLLATSDKVQRPSSASINTPRSSLIEGYTAVHFNVRWRDVINFILSTSAAYAVRRFISLETMVQIIAARRQRRPEHLLSSTTVSLDAAQKVVSIYLRLRPLLFTANNECLFDCIALSYFLSAYNFYPYLIFGVATDPFLAHCWLQHDDVVINDDPEYVLRFSPIMIV